MKIIKDLYFEFLPLSILSHAAAIFLLALYLETGWFDPFSQISGAVFVCGGLLVVVFGVIAAMNLNPSWVRRIPAFFLFAGIPFIILLGFGPDFSFGSGNSKLALIVIGAYFLILFWRELKRRARVPRRPDYFKAGIFLAIIFLFCFLLAVILTWKAGEVDWRGVRFEQL